MYHVSAQGVDERMINVQYYYYYLLRAASVTQGWNGYRKRESAQKVYSEEKIFPPLLLGLKPATFRSRVPARGGTLIT